MYLESKMSSGIYENIANLDSKTLTNVMTVLQGRVSCKISVTVEN